MPANAGDLGIALKRLLDNPKEGREMGRRGRQLILEQYTWENVAARLKKVYEQIISGEAQVV